MPSSKPLTSADLDNFLKGFKSSLDKLAEQLGHVGALGTTPMFSEQAAQVKSDRIQAEKDFEEAEANFRLMEQETDILNKQARTQNDIYGIISDIVEARRKLNDAIMIGDAAEEQAQKEIIAQLKQKEESLNNQLSILDKQVDKINDLKANGQDLNSLESDRIAKMVIALEKRNQEQKILGKISEEMSYQNKKLEEGVTLQERINHTLDKNLMNTKRFMNGISEIKNGFSQLISSSLELVKPWGELDQAAADYAKHIGLSQRQYAAMRSDMINFTTNNNIGGKYNTNAKELIQLQEKYNSSIGRRVTMTNNELENMAAMKSILGDEGASQFASQLENFGLNPEEVGNRVGEMFKESSKYGVAFDKYTKNFTDSLKLAQNYTFDGGLKNLREMARRATEIKLDIQQVANFADKVSTLEGSMQAAAQLSVLGGSFARYSDPLRMLYLGLNDVGGLEKHIEGMFGDKAFFNRKTGQMEVSAFNRQRIKAATEATGMDYSKTMESIYAQGRQRIVGGQIIGDFTDDEKSAIKNQAQLDENGRGYVTINGERRDVSTLNKEDVKILMKTGLTDSDNIKTIAQTLLGWDEKLSATKKSIDDQKALVAENLGIGDIAKGVLDWVQKNAATVARIQMILVGMSALMGIGGIFNGGWNALTSFRGGNGVGKITPNPVGVSSGSVSSSTIGGTHVSGRNSYAAYETSRLRGHSVAGSIKSSYQAARYNGSGKIGAGLRAGGSALRSGLFRYGTGIGTVAGIGGIVGGQMLKSNAQEHMDRGDFSNAVENRNNWGGALSGAGAGLSTGLMIGSIFGVPGALIGGAIGAIGGGAIGYFSAKSSYENQHLRNEIYKKSGKNGTPLVLKGDYTNEELRLIAKGGKSYIESNNELSQRIEQQEGIRISDIQPFANGGIVNGKGSGISDSNLALLSNNEYIMPASKVAKPNNLAILDSMRNGNDLIPRFSNGGINNQISQNRSTDRIIDILPSKRNDLIPRFSNGGINNQILPNRSTDRINITPVGNELNTMRVSKPNNFGSEVAQVGPSKIELSPINVSGTIKLDLGNYSKEIDSKQLLNNPVFIKKITDEIMKRVNTQTHMGYDKNSFYKKF